MTHFEYLFVAVSIVISFTLLRLLDAVPTAFSRERGYWVHAVWVLFALFLCAAFWWLNWVNRNLEELTFRYFLFLLVSPSILFLASTALVTASPATMTSWREHFFKVRRRFFLGLLIYLALLTVNSYVTLGVPVMHRLRLGQVVMLALFVSGALVSSERGQSVVGACAATFLGGAVVLALSGWLPMKID